MKWGLFFSFSLLFALLFALVLLLCYFILFPFSLFSPAQTAHKLPV